MKSDYIKSFRLFFRFFIITWVFHIAIQTILQLMDVDLKENYSAIYYLNLTLNAFHILVFIYLLFYLIKKNYPELIFPFERMISESKNINIIYCALLGFSLGYVLPLMSNSAIYLENTMVSDMATLAINSYVEIYKGWSFLEFIIYFIIACVIYNFFREYFFRQVLLSLMARDENITRSTIQVSFLFLLSYYIYQINTLDFIAIFLLSIILCFIFYKTKSVLIVTVTSIAYELPVYLLYFVPNLKENANNYLTINESNVFFVFAAGIAVYYSLYLLNQDKGTIEKSVK